MPFLLSVTEPIDLGSLILSPMDILMRLLCAMIVGTVIGLEREYTHRPAGLRTHILVSLGACAVMITGQLIFCQYRPFGSTADPARLAAQVISGVGFLGAGTIMREGVNVKGLTTAASLWAVACLGIAAGGGYYEVALLGMVLVSGVVQGGLPGTNELRGILFGLSAAVLYASVVLANRFLHDISAYTKTVAQLLIAPYVTACFEEADSLSDTVRGEGGYGSTGRK